MLALAAAVGTALLVSAGAPATPGAVPTPCDGVAVAVDGGALDRGASDDGASDDDASDEDASDGVPLGVPLGVVSALGCATVDSTDSTVSAHDAATAAGVELEGTQQWGAAFVCRVDGRPAVDEEVRRADGSVGTEPCQRTPSQGAYWSLWTSSGGSEWVYADRGATRLVVAPGDAVGLVFVTSDRPQPPQVAPAEALAGISPAGWGTVGASRPTGADSHETSGPVDGPTVGADTPESPGALDGLAAPDGPAGPGTVALVGLGLAAVLLGLAGLRARARRR